MTVTPPASAPNLPRLPGSETPIGVAVLGCGYWGPNLVRNFFDTPGCRVVAVCDASPKRLEAISRRFPSAATVTDFDDILKNPAIDAVAIATPVETHAPLARRVLESGRHVLVEKPLTSSSTDAAELVELAARKKLTLMVDHTFIYTGAVRKMKALVDNGELGRLYYYDSVRVNLGLIQHDVSVIWDLAAHDFAIMDYLLQQRPLGVNGMAVAHLAGGMSDMAYLTVTFADNLIAHFHVNWLSPVKVRQVLLGGDRRMVLYDDIQPTEKVRVYDRGVRLSDDANEARRQVLVGYRLGDMYAPVLDQTEALRIGCGHFIDCIRKGQKPITDGEAGLRVVRLLEAAERSVKNGGAMEKWEF